MAVLCVFIRRVVGRFVRPAAVCRFAGLRGGGGVRLWLLYVTHHGAGLSAVRHGRSAVRHGCPSPGIAGPASLLSGMWLLLSAWGGRVDEHAGLLTVAGGRG